MEAQMKAQMKAQMEAKLEAKMEATKVESKVDALQAQLIELVSLLKAPLTATAVDVTVMNVST
eukprot:3213815-Prymnesium_polylepis.1